MMCRSGRSSISCSRVRGAGVQFRGEQTCATSTSGPSGKDIKLPAGQDDHAGASSATPPISSSIPKLVARPDLQFLPRRSDGEKRKSQEPIAGWATAWHEGARLGQAVDTGRRREGSHRTRYGGRGLISQFPEASLFGVENMPRSFPREAGNLVFCGKAWVPASAGDERRLVG